jgi:mannose-6-phosphate isomerase-like protein (cupin superfamily)
MQIIHRDALEKNYLPGRIIEKAVGKDSFSESKEMTVGFGHYSDDSGPMKPHRHAEEVVYIVSSKAGRICYGTAPDDLDLVVPLEPGMILHIPEGEWHVFEFEPGGHVEIIFIYGRVENIRAEDD